MFPSDRFSFFSETETKSSGEGKAGAEILLGGPMTENMK